MLSGVSGVITFAHTKLSLISGQKMQMLISIKKLPPMKIAMLRSIYNL